MHHLRAIVMIMGMLAGSLLAAETITVNYPNGGEALHAVQIVNITWNAAGFSDNVELAYSLDNGANYTLIASVPHTPGSYAWTVPGVTNSTQCKVRVRRSTGGVAADESDAVFSIQTFQDIGAGLLGLASASIA